MIAEKKAVTKKKTKPPKLIMNIADCRYDILNDLAYEMGFKVCEEEGKDNWDLYWTDFAVQPEQLNKMKPYQKINHWPGMYVLSRKNNLAKQLMKMYKKFPSYNFFPQTWVVPSDISDLR